MRFIVTTFARYLWNVDGMLRIDSRVDEEIPRNLIENLFKFNQKTHNICALKCLPHALRIG